MLEKVDTGKKISKEEYKKLMPQLELKLSELQRKTRELKIPVVIVFEGWDAAGKGTLINEMILPLDPRGFNVYTTMDPNEEEKLRPPLWRFWVRTPSKGRWAIFDRSWYKKVIDDRAVGKIEVGNCDKTYHDINSFEKQLSDDGNVIIKFFLHIDKKEQRERFEKLEENPATAWRVTEEDWKHHKKYKEYIPAIEEAIEKTGTEHSQWTIVESHDKNFAVIKIFTTLIGTIQKKIDVLEKKHKPLNKSGILIPGKNTLNSSVLDKVDLSQNLTEEEYKAKLKKYQKKIREIEYEMYSKRLPLIILYEGWDAAGKGGNIKRLTRTLDPRGYEVVPVSAPNDTEKEHHYLWRFWRSIPKAGHLTIFDRTWYGRVLVERVEGFCNEEEWKRAYKEINDMEEQIVNSGAVLVKFWLHIDKDEQLKRFEERQNNEYKKWKITEEDWRNREKWDQYKEAVDEMIFRTSTAHAPWTIVESNSKFHARIKTLKTVIDAVERKLK